jgi:hypothetical protein
VFSSGKGPPPPTPATLANRPDVKSQGRRSGQGRPSRRSLLVERWPSGKAPGLHPEVKAACLIGPDALRGFNPRPFRRGSCALLRNSILTVRQRNSSQKSDGLPSRLQLLTGQPAQPIPHPLTQVFAVQSSGVGESLLLGCFQANLHQLAFRAASRTGPSATLPYRDGADWQVCQRC